MNRKQDSNSDLKEKAQTALALMTYIAELKESANALAEQISTNEQGVFRPDQEASVLDLLVGYWQSRNALHSICVRWNMEIKKQRYNLEACI